MISDSRFRPAAVIPPFLSLPLAPRMLGEVPPGSKAAIARSIRFSSSLSCFSISSLFKGTPTIESATDFVRNCNGGLF